MVDYVAQLIPVVPTASALNFDIASTFEMFGKFVHEAEQNRAPQIRLGQEIANRTRLYFHDYLEDLSADMQICRAWSSGRSHSPMKFTIAGVRKKIASTWMKI